MLRYLNNHQNKFSNVLAPFCITQMKLYGALFTEIINLLLICGQETVMDCIINYIALGAISQIDNYYAAALTKFPLKKALEDPLVYENFVHVPFCQRDKAGKFMRLIVKGQRIIYISMYFYFTPYITPLITYLIAGNNN